jgi:ABC-type Zn uptake system ZnuABC Zn-binding protein ZnuA
VAQLVRDSDSPAVFAERGFDTSLMQEVATTTGAELCTLESDILAEPGSTYFEMMRRNVDEIVRCLGGG